MSMMDQLYSDALKDWAQKCRDGASLAAHHKDGAFVERSPSCGSQISIKLSPITDAPQGSQLFALPSYEASQACLLAQAAMAMMLDCLKAPYSAQHSQALLDEVSAFLRDTNSARAPLLCPAIAALEPARALRSRHASILLPFRALVGAHQAFER